MAIFGLRAAGIAIASVAAATHVGAQTVEMAPAPPPADSGQQVAEIVVTAERRAERLQDVPLTVTAITSETLAASGVSGISSLQSAVPSVAITESVNTAQPFIRGIGSSVGNANAESSVAIYLDGVYQPAAFGNFFEFSNIERVEVLEGPQGTLFGHNATGGVIQVITRDPLRTPEAEVSLGYANYDTLSASTYVSLPITEKLAFNAAVVYSDRKDGWGRYLLSGQRAEGDEELGARAKLVYRPGDATKITLAANYTHSQNIGFFVQNIFGSPTLNGQGYPGNFNTWSNATDTSAVVSGGGSLHVEQDFNALKFVSISAYSRTTGEWKSDTDASPINEVYADLRQLGRMYTQEFHLLSEQDSAIQWLVGAFYFNYTAGHPFENLAGLSVAPFKVFDFRTIVNTQSESLFGQATAPLPWMADTHLTLGIRENHDRIVGHASSFVDGSAILGPQLFGPNTTPTESYTKPTWRIVLDHDFGHDVMAYASYNRGIKSGNINDGADGLPGVDAPYKPEQLDAYELGLKTELLDRRIRWNSSAYYYDYKDYQYQQDYAGGVVVVNAPKATLYGFESQFQARATEDLTVNLAVGLEHSAFGDFPGAPPANIRLPDGSLRPGNPGYNARGNQVPWAAKFTGLVGFTYKMPINRTGTYTLSSSLYRFGGAPSEINNQVREPAYNLLSASLDWRDPTQRFDVNLWGRNLTNSYYFVQLQGQIAGSVGLDVGNPAPPRTYGVTLKYTFK